MSGGDRPVRDLVAAAGRRLAAADVASPRVDAETLAAHLLGLTRGELVATSLRGATMCPRDAARYRVLVEERAARVPLQHLTGSAPFRRLLLAVGPGVFVPRPETELLAGWAIEAAAAVASPLVVDLCTGSGAIALAVAEELPAARVVAVELDDRALDWARGNRAAQAAAVADRVDLRRGDVTTDLTAADGVLADLAGRVDVVVANPPYIPDGAVPVEVEVARHDPEVALYGGGADGLGVPRGVVALARRLLRPGGLLLMEHADVQGAAARGLVAGLDWSAAATLVDLAGRDRVLTARRAGGIPGDG